MAGSCVFIIVMISDRLKKRFYSLLEREKGKEKKREKNINMRKKHRLVASHMCPDQELNPNSGKWPDWESNP